MPQGLEVRDSSGNVTVTISDRLTKILGSQDISAPGSITATRLAGNNLFASFLPASGDPFDSQPVVTISGNTISWTYASTTDRATGTLVWGQY